MKKFSIILLVCMVAVITEWQVFPTESAGGMIKDQLDMRFSVDTTKTVREALIAHFKKAEKKKYEKVWHEKMMQPWQSDAKKRKSNLDGLFER